MSMVWWREGTVTAIRRHWRGAVELDVTVTTRAVTDPASVRALAYPQLVGEPRLGELPEEPDQVPARRFGGVEIDCIERVGHDLVKELIHGDSQRDVHDPIIGDSARVARMPLITRR